VQAFQRDPHPSKINLGVGAYRDDHGQPYLFQVVQQAEHKLQTTHINPQCLPPTGHPSFCENARKLITGNCDADLKGRVVSVQAMSGTGALALGFLLLAKTLPRLMYIPDPTWPNHRNMITDCGLQWVEYPYLNYKTIATDIKKMVGFLDRAVAGSVVLLHACAHNPTGIDPTR
jgi:aspartate/tyrosine/aromatic aminotransferase